MEKVKNEKKSDNLALKDLLKPIGPPKIPILGVSVDDIREKDAISKIIGLATDKRGHHFVATVNSEFVMMARKDEEFAKILQSADLSLPDGAGVVLAKLILGGSRRNRVTGADLVEKLCEKASVLPITIGFLGGFSSVAEIVAKRQRAKFPGLKVAISESGDPTMGHDSRLKSEIFGKKRVDILFVAYGMGRQEFWIARNRNDANVGVFIGVGGALDYLSGLKLRAPVFMRKSGLEWLWRLIFEPSRIWRMRVLPVFVVLVLWQRLIILYNHHFYGRYR